MYNEQPISKPTFAKNGDLEVHSVFKTIQGEGPFVGVSCVFVRLAGCNLQCPLCDTDYTNKDMQLTSVESLHFQVEELLGPTDLVVITGGEPFRQNLTPFVLELLEAGIQVQIETNGTLYLDQFPYDDITIVCSPKTGSINSNLKKHITAYKYVLHADHVDPFDGLPDVVLGNLTKAKVARPHDTFCGTVYVQPVDTNSEMNKIHLECAKKSCLTYGYTLGVQLHKIIGVA